MVNELKFIALVVCLMGQLVASECCCVPMSEIVSLFVSHSELKSFSPELRFMLNVRTLPQDAIEHNVSCLRHAENDWGSERAALAEMRNGGVVHEAPIER